MEKLVFDRTINDIINLTSKGYYNYEDLNRIEKWCEYLSKFLKKYNYFSEVKVKKNWSVTSFPTQSEMKRVHQNINNLKSSFIAFTSVPENLEYITFQKANKIEKILFEIDKIISYMENNFIYCGVSNCGQDRIWQQQFRKPKTWISQPYKLSQYANTDTLKMIATKEEIIIPTVVNKYSINNKLSNGSLKLNTDDWIMSTSNSYASEGSYTTVKITANGTGTFPNYQYFDEISGCTEKTKQIIYACAKIKGRTTNTSYPRVYISYNKNDSETVSYSNLSSIDGLSGSTLNDGEWHMLSSQLTTYNSNGYFVYNRIAFGINTATADDEMDIKDILLINLTEIFGAGNEPTKKWCDENIKYNGFDFEIGRIEEVSQGTSILNLAQIDKRDDVYASTQAINDSMQAIDDLVGYECFYYTLKNIIGDSSFENDLWNDTNYSTSEKMYGNRSLYFPAGATVIANIVIDRPIVGHKYYGRRYIKTNGNNLPTDCRFEVYGGDGDGLNWVYAWNQGNYPEWGFDSAIHEIISVNYDETTRTIIRCFNVNATADTWLDGLMLIDLTETFGEGKEPNKEWCDANIPYFDGIQTIKVRKENS